VSINSAYPTSTPPYFVWLLEFYGQDSYDLVLYGRNREDIPFGAAVWPDDFNLLNSEPIPLRNQYSKKNNETIFAGRPYGCANGSQGSGCDHIGYCSLDPSVYCLYSGTTSPAYDINKQSCGSGGYGQCLPLWNSGFYPKDHGGDTADYKNILKTIFLRSYGSYAYSFSDRAYSQEGATYDYANPTTISSCQTRPVASYNNFPNSVDSFCAVYPRISNLTLKFNDKALGPAGAFNKFNINARGIYRLEFNTLVDSEQQPLREIRINWDDGEPVQVITGQDHHPSPSNPHVFYHYYRQPGTYSIFITIFDNWGFYGSLSRPY